MRQPNGAVSLTVETYWLRDYDSLENCSFIGISKLPVRQMRVKIRDREGHTRPLPCHGTFGNFWECTGTEGKK